MSIIFSFLSLRSTDSGPRTTDYGPRTADYGLRTTSLLAPYRSLRICLVLAPRLRGKFLVGCVTAFMKRPTEVMVHGPHGQPPTRGSKLVLAFRRGIRKVRALSGKRA